MTGHDKYINNRRVSKTFAKINRPWAKLGHKVDLLIIFRQDTFNRRADIVIAVSP